MLSRFTIYGERCSGTNFLEESILCNFEAELTWDFGFKHYFGHSLEYNDSEDCLFLCIVREGYSWINSLRKNPHHLEPSMNKDNDTFLSKEVMSLDDDKNKNRMKEDRNWKTKEPFKNIFELRQIKTEYMLDVLPQKVRHSLFFRYEDLCTDFQREMNRVALYLHPKKHVVLSSHLFFSPSWYKKVYTESHKKDEKDKKDEKMIISEDEFYLHPNYQIIQEQERRLGYIL